MNQYFDSDEKPMFNGEITNLSYLIYSALMDLLLTLKSRTHSKEAYNRC